MFFPKTGSSGKPAIIDFQGCFWCWPALDCERMLAFSLPTDWRRKHELALMQAWFGEGLDVARKNLEGSMQKSHDVLL